MKKVITVFISLLMILSLAACGNSASQTGQPSTEEKPMESTADNVGSVESGTSVENTEATEKQPEETEASGNAGIPEDPEEQGTKVLVAYFSATNTTQGIAEHIANGLNADIYEIVPSVSPGKSFPGKPAGFADSPAQCLIPFGVWDVLVLNARFVP